MNSDIEQISIQQVEISKKLISNVKQTIASMKALRHKLRLNHGCGQRYLQKTRPTEALLKQAEKEIMAKYSNSNEASSGSSSLKNSTMLKNLALRNKI